MKSGTTTTPLARVWRAVESVNDPEIPVLSVVELGIIPDIRIEDTRVVVEMCPTFAGCPALDTMRNNIKAAVENAGFNDVQVKVVFDPPWTSDRISVEGLRKLKEFGLAPPMQCNGSLTEDMLHQITCPFCDSNNTTLESIFGPTLCRSIHYCNDCLQSFEQFKPV
ncbi:MAG: phenylacetate-CoA oxygenase subunit PaaJ [Planctomycetes bacterium]|nr:phenylacetate-CoA oxygenase subunit PaaJ [Planctomycetota bacterium]